MSRPLVPLLDSSDDPLGGALFEALRQPDGSILNLHRAMGHAPLVMKVSSEMAKLFRESKLLPRTLAELAVLRTAHLLKSNYVWTRHRELGLKCGLTAEQIELVRTFRDGGAFDADERAVLEFADATVSGARLPDDYASLMQERFSPQAIVELAMMICSYVSTARFLAVLQVPDEGKEPSA